jgi:hypothetical protein
MREKYPQAGRNNPRIGERNLPRWSFSNSNVRNRWIIGGSRGLGFGVWQRKRERGTGQLLFWAPAPPPAWFSRNVRRARVNSRLGFRHTLYKHGYGHRNGDVRPYGHSLSLLSILMCFGEFSAELRYDHAYSHMRSYDESLKSLLIFQFSEH